MLACQNEETDEVCHSDIIC